MSLHANYYTNRGANADDIAEPRKLTELELEIAEVNAHDMIMSDDDTVLTQIAEDESIKALRDLYESWARPGGRRLYSAGEISHILSNLHKLMDSVWEPVFEAEKNKILEDKP